MSAAHPLTNLQQELLKIYDSNISEADLLHIKDYLARYFAGKAISEADSIWDQKGYTVSGCLNPSEKNASHFRNLRTKFCARFKD